ncbi:hypothetical protein RFM98_31085 [Mesorhizobium sp. VK9D]|uniref:hypothetical protein n=1 Tax=Mesorhizobium australafricanum TaxID=3072311 RepID=UPI002A23C3DA|nr:hypothetical protein [Mesorhizobium sp. VK9D]MDX8457167.1 hypothetical protein [Mesorhizobium sp. VK9D]
MLHAVARSWLGDKVPNSNRSGVSGSTSRRPAVENLFALFDKDDYLAMGGQIIDAAEAA